ncbi:MAG: DUF1818 family protein [Cyanobacteria bacterium P01_G01_bin.67]
MECTIKTGDGWRIGWQTQNSKYQGLVGANDWAIELTKAEFRDFQRLLMQLVATMKEMEAELMDEEKISCEAESDLLWLEAIGYPNHYALRLILNCDRRCEGNWTEGVAPDLAEGFKSFGVGII